MILPLFNEAVEETVPDGPPWLSDEAGPRLWLLCKFELLGLPLAPDTTMLAWLYEGGGTFGAAPCLSEPPVVTRLVEVLIEEEELIATESPLPCHAMLAGEGARFA